MKATIISNIIITLLICVCHKTNGQVKLHTEDLPRFYVAFDSVMTTDDTIKQEYFIQKMYLDKASSGLNEFLDLRGGNAKAFRRFIVSNKSSLIEKKPWILSVLDQESEIRSKLAVFKNYYPNFRDGDIYFCVGIGNSGGTPYDKTVYIGTEVFANSRPNWALDFVLHEFAHTQQWAYRKPDKLPMKAQNDQKLADEYAETHKEIKEYNDTHKQLLGKCIEEGMADFFVTELVLGKSLSEIYSEDDPIGSHTAFGLKHEQSIWDEFKKDMLLDFDYKKGWLYSWKQIDDK